PDQLALRIDLERVDVLRPAGVGHVEHALVRREGQAVGIFAVGDERCLPVRRDAIDAGDRQLALGERHAQARGRGVDAAPGPPTGVDGAVARLPLPPAHRVPALYAVPARDPPVAALAHDEPAMQVEGRTVALARVRPHELGLLAGDDLVQMAPADVDEVVEAVGVPDRALGEDEARGQPLGLLRLDDRGQRVAHDVAPRFFVRSSPPARPSWSLKNVIESLSPQPRPSASSSCCSASAAIIIGTWYSRPSSVARPTSFRSSRSAKFTSSKAPGNTVLGIMSFS